MGTSPDVVERASKPTNWDEVRDTVVNLGSEAVSNIFGRNLARVTADNNRMLPSFQAAFLLVPVDCDQAEIQIVQDAGINTDFYQKGYVVVTGEGGAALVRTPQMMDQIGPRLPGKRFWEDLLDQDHSDRPLDEKMKDIITLGEAMVRPWDSLTQLRSPEGVALIRQASLAEFTEAVKLAKERKREFEKPVVDYNPPQDDPVEFLKALA